MKVWLEDKELTHRGIMVASENEEEKRILTDIWTGDARVCSFGRVQDSVSITIAPTADQEEKK